MFIFVVALAVNCGVTFRSSYMWKKMTGAQTSAEKEDAVQKKQWEALLRKCLIVYLLATVSDWMQGPYVYALYSDYKYSQYTPIRRETTCYSLASLASFIHSINNTVDCLLFVLLSVPLDYYPPLHIHSNTNNTVDCLLLDAHDYFFSQVNAKLIAHWKSTNYYSNK